MHTQFLVGMASGLYMGGPAERPLNPNTNAQHYTQNTHTQFLVGMAWGLYMDQLAPANAARFMGEVRELEFYTIR